jgi:hypothetical protein
MTGHTGFGSDPDRVLPCLGITKKALGLTKAVMHDAVDGSIIVIF